MKICHLFEIHGAPDPFTLLKVSQAFHEISSGESLEFISGGTLLPEEIFKVLPAGQYEIVRRDQYEDPVRCRIVLQKCGEVTVHE